MFVIGISGMVQPDSLTPRQGRNLLRDISIDTARQAEEVPDLLPIVKVELDNIHYRVKVTAPF